MLKLQKYARSIRNLGGLAFARYWWHQKTKLPRTGVFDLTTRYADHPLQCRAGTSDIDVFKHIYVLREYACFDGLADPGLIVDCGANVGMSAAYFLSRFPNAKVIAVEPDPGNYQQLLHNTRTYGQRLHAVQAGVWHKGVGLKFAEDGFGDGRAWAVAVEEARPDEQADLQAVSVAALLEASGHERIALLKIDIEGSEQALFSEGVEAWLGRVDNLVIELHGQACERVFYKAIEPYGFDVQASGGVVICRSRQSTRRDTVPA
ncbi:MAG: FkbM family methyltransferase [Phycisphaeraceae bacterium]|nr:FkbM family methyltransferase [Phycisphaeraceae bacterium]